MRIEAYFQQVREAVETCPVAQAFNVTYDKRSTYEGLIRGEVYFIDGMDSAQRSIFRYDNTGHHPTSQTVIL